MNRKVKSTNTKLNVQYLFAVVCRLINESKISIAVAVKQRLTILYWNIGKMIKNETLNNKRADYGEQVIHNLSKKLTGEYGRGWSKQQLWNCLYIVEIFPKEKIISTLSGELSWSQLYFVHTAKAENLTGFQNALKPGSHVLSSLKENLLRNY